MPHDPYRSLKTLLHGEKSVQNVTWGEIAEALQVSTVTARNRLNNPDTMTLGDLQKLARLFGIKPDTIRSTIPI